MKLEFKKSLKYHVEVEDYTAPINEEYHYHIELTMSNSNDTYILDTDDLLPCFTITACYLVIIFEAINRRLRSMTVIYILFILYK